MKDILLQNYQPLADKELEDLAQNFDNKAILDFYKENLDLQIKRYELAYRLEVVLLKLIPIATLFTYLLAPGQYKIIFGVAVVLALLIEGIVTSIFPRKLYTKIIRNSVLIDSFITLSKK